MVLSNAEQCSWCQDFSSVLNVLVLANLQARSPQKVRFEPDFQHMLPCPLYADEYEKRKISSAPQRPKEPKKFFTAPQNNAMKVE